MSDADIEIRNAVQSLVMSGKEVTVTSVQEALKESSFFVGKGITLVPSEWIAPILTEEGGPFPEYKGV